MTTQPSRHLSAHGLTRINLAASFIAVSTLLPELEAEALVLWRVRASSGHHLCCSVSSRKGELVLKIHQPATDAAIISQVHADIASLVDHAADLLERYHAVGWDVVDIEPPELD